MKHSRPGDALPKKRPASVKKKAEVEKQPRRQPTEDTTSIRIAIAPMKSIWNGFLEVP
jgi:hypothetical protein